MDPYIERREPKGLLDRAALALATFGVGYIPGAPGTYGSAIALLIYHLATYFADLFDHRFAQPRGFTDEQTTLLLNAIIPVLLLAFCLIGIWAANRSIELLGNSDPKQVVVDEVVGQLVTFAFIPFVMGWRFILAGFILFRLFDIWKPYPIDLLQDIHGGLGIVADDVVAGIYAGICLAAIYAVTLSI